ncbi:zinc finger protein castor homolog 1 [Trichomycterus rosablanca]|uniref:zinc finger protein castor homolog 1 n=1 Tax=Trichomycterus rosablanca TaxID=2290929 RepID=UPI002F35ECF4
MKVTCLGGFNFDSAEYAERSLCTETTSGKSAMAAKRKGGLKLNAICAKLSRQVVYDGSSQNAENDPSLADTSERGSSHYDEGDRPDSDFSEGLSLGQSLEDDQKRREAIEKWVNGEYADDLPSPEGDEPRGPKANGRDDGPPEGVYMVQPKGCSDEDDNRDETEAMPLSHEGSYHDDRDSDSPNKETGCPPTSETPNCQASFSSPVGEASALRDYAANTMNEFLHMFGYEDQQGRDELAKKFSFEKLKAATSDPSSLGGDEATRRARFSKYEEYIRKLKAGETLPWPIPTKPEKLNSKEKSPVLLQPTACLPGAEAQMFSPGMEHKQGQLGTPAGMPAHNLATRTSKYDFFIQKLKMGESLRQQNGNAYKRPSKYDLENVKYLHLFKPGEGNPDMGGAIAFKTGKVGRPSKYDIRNIQKLLPGKGDSPMMPSVLSSKPATPGTPVIPTAASAGAVGPPCLPVDQVGHLGFNTDYMKSSFSKTDSITTGTVSSVKNGLPVEKPVTDDVNVYQKYIARFSGSQHCGHVHCAYQYREHYHCMDPECNYQRFTSKQDVIRHYNMHKKRDNSLQHGFMRFSPLDDCSVYYHGCHLNGKSTHYHCMQVGCNKVYTSTSDVMTHENFHKKNAQLINDGFQRFRATEDCGTVICQFYGQKTTHFHCRRPGCTFTFKNKCDIEKHKSYHIKDDAYAKDGFKKFYKYEECKYDGCVYSKATNHFHCIRQGCGFTFTSTSQMTSHKRKHERRHVRSSGMMGLTSSFLLPKEEQEESSNDDLVDFSAVSSKNSSLSASPTTQQPSTVPHLMSTPTIASSSSLNARPTPALPATSRMSTLLSQALPSNMSMALAFSGNALTGAPNPFLSLRLPLQIPSAAAGMISAASSGALSTPRDSVAPSSCLVGEATSLASTPTSYSASSIMEKISASKGLISPTMARLAAAALNPIANLDTGNRFNPVQVKQEPVDAASAGSHESMQEHSLDLSKKEHGNESNGHPAPGNPSLLSSLMNKMAQGNSGFLGAMNIKSEMDAGQLNDGSDAAQYLSRLIKRPVPEKPAELWRTYLRRYDTDEVCDTQCDFLHKVHFHCVVEDCGALFSTVDGAIKHANFHLRANLKVKPEGAFSEAKESGESAPNQPISMANTPPMDVPGAAVSGTYGSLPSMLVWKQLAGSIPPLPASMPIMAACSPLATTSLENAKPQVKPGFLQFQDNDPCLATDCKYSNKFHFHCLFGNCKYVCKTSGKAESHCLDHINPNNSLVNVRDQFSYYSLQCLCPNQHCEFRMRGHYHCIKQGCFFVTNITTKLPWHIKKHEKAERRAANGFKYFTKREECGRLGCKYNQVNSHFHCIREACMFSFLLKHQMTSHARKHMRRMLGKNFDRVPSQVVPHGHQAEEMQNMASLASSGTMSTHPSLTSSFSNMMEDNDDYIDYMGGGSPLGLSSDSSNQDRSCTSTPVGNDSSPAGPGSQVPALTPTSTPTSTTFAETSPSSTPQSAPPPPPPPPLPVPPLPQAPFQSQPPSFPPTLLRPPLPSFPYLLSPSCVSYSLLSASLGATRSVVMPTNTPAFSPIIAAPSPVKNDVPIVQDAAGNTISIPTASGAKKRFWIIEDMSPFGKRRKTASSRKMLDEGMMLDGFRRYDLYEDCRDTTCQFSLKVTHYHCTRENCGYRFCGRTHMYKHAQHHDRVDNLVLDDFKRFKASLSCDVADCQFSGNSTHFHCLRCSFRCTDSTKVTAHRKHHGKQDVISAAGFCQFSSSIDCTVPDCKYKLKCSHFHCTYPECKHTVVGMSQMDSHKRKHEKQERGDVPPSVSPSCEGAHHQPRLAGLPVSITRPPTSPRALMHSSASMYMAPAADTDYHPYPAFNLDGSLNLATDAPNSLFFLKNASGLGLGDSLDLSKKFQQREQLLQAASMNHPQDDTTGTSGDLEDDLSAEEEPTHEEEEEEEDEEEEDDDDEEPEEEMNTDSYDDSMPDADKDNAESLDASVNHSVAFKLDEDDVEAIL